jgi:hypothetical protein
VRLEQGHVAALTDPRGAVHLSEDTARARFDLVSLAAALAADRWRDHADAVSAFDAAPDADSVADTRPTCSGARYWTRHLIRASG